MADTELEVGDFNVGSIDWKSVNYKTSDKASFSVSKIYINRLGQFNLILNYASRILDYVLCIL